MPFKSNKQKRYMHSKLPKMANNWEKEYQEGGPIDDIDLSPERIDDEGFSIDKTYGPTEEQITQELQTLNQDSRGPVTEKDSKDDILGEIYNSLWYLDTASLHNLSPNPEQKRSKDVLWSIYHNNQDSIENFKLDGLESSRLDIAKQILDHTDRDLNNKMKNVFKNLGPEELELLNTHYRNKAMDYQNQLLQDKEEYDKNSMPLKDLIPAVKKFFDFESSEIMKEGGKLKEPPKGSVKDLKIIVDELLNASKMHKGQSKRIDKHLKMMQEGGTLKGPSHDDGGIPGKVRNSDQPLEFEGGEVVINTSVNKAADKHEEGLLALNKNPDEFEIVRKTDARKRQNRFG
tara:strand:+ start:1972 stop:3006 length:1035 start_codon:yes stop_codon:yes gene_type:complete